MSPDPGRPDAAPPGEWMEHRVGDADRERLDAYVATHFPFSRTRAVQLITAGHVLLNGKVPKKRDVARTGDLLRVRVPAPEISRIDPEEIPLSIVFEDGDLLVIDKAAGMVVHPAPGHRGGTLVNALLHHVSDLSGIGGVARPGIVHRLDRDTSGLLIVAKHDRAHNALAEALRAREVRRRYLTLAWGHLTEASFVVDQPVARHTSDRKRMAVVEGGRRAVTRFRRVERWPAAELLQAQLETGRTHQIRVHLQHLGHPVVGDAVYGAGRERGFSGHTRAWALELAQRTPRQFLHAAELRFQHPSSGEDLRFTSPLPADLQAVMDWAKSSMQADD